MEPPRTPSTVLTLAAFLGRTRFFCYHVFNVGRKVVKFG